jgi:hypothetical protein
MSFHPVRAVLYIFFVSYDLKAVCDIRSCGLQFMFSVILLGLTAYRTHYTKQQDRTDILTSRRHFYSAFYASYLAFRFYNRCF